MRFFLLLLALKFIWPLVPLEAFQVTFFDLPEGEAILIKTQGKNILIDSGPVISCSNLKASLRRENVSRLDLLIVTHPHPDHYSGVFCLYGDLYPASFSDNGQPLPSFPRDDFLRWYGLWRKEHPHYRPLRAEEVLFIGDLSIKVLWPREYSGNFNTDSLVLLIEEGQGRLLLTGDIPASTEKRLVKIYGDRLWAQVLKVSHHGAADASSESFLKAVSPKVAVVCAARDHPRGYPAKEVLDRLEALVGKVWVTGQKGTFSLMILPNGKIEVLE
ncbi:ComEC/Rec2 family competence protein [Thermosulfuriphilus sp.]